MRLFGGRNRASAVAYRRVLVHTLTLIARVSGLGALAGRERKCANVDFRDMLVVGKLRGILFHFVKIEMSEGRKGADGCC